MDAHRQGTTRKEIRPGDPFAPGSAREGALAPEMVEAMQADLVPEGVVLPGWRDGAINYGMGWWKHEEEPGLLIDSGAFGARSLRHPAEDWGAVFIMEDESENGTELRKRLVQAIRAAVRAADAFEVQAS